MQKHEFSKIKEVVATWNNIRQMLRSGDQGILVPVVIPKDRRGFGWWFPVALGLYLIVTGLLGGGIFLAGACLGVLVFGAAIVQWILGSIIEIEQGTTGVKSAFGKIAGTLGPGRHFLLMPWDRVEFIVDTSTEIPYTAPVLASPTQENVPLKSIEFFLKFRIVDPIAFVRNIGASNFDVVLSSAVQDAIRQRSRIVQTERAYDLRSSDVGDMQELLNRLMKRYGVMITGANIPDVQLPDQYQQHLATRERVSKELAAYEREWELIRKQRTDTLLMEIERAKKERDAKLVEVRTAVNKAREVVAQMLEERETEAQKVRWQIETRGRAELKAAENEARALRHLGKAYKDNRAVLQYELALRRLQVAQALMLHAPRPLLMKTSGAGETSALSTLAAGPDVAQPDHPLADRHRQPTGPLSERRKQHRHSRRARSTNLAGVAEPGSAAVKQ
ncbi:MAG: SPFH domain-containing protein [Chloroflexaceae bacterium]|nr:SPFH domain-containing protein [Chloroflexaceae bacterium]